MAINSLFNSLCSLRTPLSVEERLKWTDMDRAAAAMTSLAGTDDTDTDCPVFIFSAGWRSGSTLVQRLICSDQSVLIWGEPFADLGMFHKMATMIEHVQHADPHAQYAIENLNDKPESTWIANLNPGYASLRRAHRAFWDTFLKQPAIERGYARWGMKCVRMHAAHIRYFKWLYPLSRMILLVRHPYDAYRSYKYPGFSWYFVRPYKYDNVVKFARHWHNLAQSFICHESDLDALTLRYEDVVKGGDTLDRMEQYLDVNINPNVLDDRIPGSRRSSAKKSKHVHLIEKKLINHVCADACGHFLYGLE